MPVDLDPLTANKKPKVRIRLGFPLMFVANAVNLDIGKQIVGPRRRLMRLLCVQTLRQKQKLMPKEEAKEKKSGTQSRRTSSATRRATIAICYVGFAMSDCTRSSRDS